MDCEIVVREFVLQSRYYVHFRANTLGKGMDPLIFQAMGWIVPLLFILEEWLWHKITYKGCYAIKQWNKSKNFSLTCLIFLFSLSSSISISLSLSLGCILSLSLSLTPIYFSPFVFLSHPPLFLSLCLSLPLLFGFFLFLSMFLLVFLL